MAHAAAITFKEFRHRYNSEDACRAELFRLPNSAEMALYSIR